eukprot:tig00000552_g2066.t1
MTSNWYQTLSGSLDVGNNTKDFARLRDSEVIELLHESGLVKKVAPATATANVLRCLEVKFRETGYGPTVNRFQVFPLSYAADQPHFSTGASLCAELRECSISYAYGTDADSVPGARVMNIGTDKVEWDGNYATPLTVRVQNPVMLRVTSNDFENPASCSVYVYFDIDSGVSADEAEALWLSGLLKKIEPSVPDRPAIRVLELKFTANTALTRKFGNGANPNIKTHLDGALIDATHKTTQAVPFEMYNLWKMTAKEMMTNATTGGASGTDYSYGASNPRTQVWPRLLFTKFTFKLYNNIAGMPTSGMVVGSTLMAELIEAEADYTTATTNSTAPGAGAEVYVAWETVGREYDTKIHTTSV